MTNTNTTVRAVKIDGLRFSVPGGVAVMSGWGLRSADGRYYTTDGVLPWVPQGGRRSAKSVEETGLLPGAKFVEVRA